VIISAGVVDFPLLRDIVVILGFCAAIVWLFSRLRMPAVVGFLAAGVLIGPHALGIVSSIHAVELLAELGVILLLFTIGIEFSLKDLLASRKLVIVGGGMQVGLGAFSVREDRQDQRRSWYRHSRQPDGCHGCTYPGSIPLPCPGPSPHRIGRDGPGK
jgi:hypothetical protein